MNNVPIVGLLFFFTIKLNIFVPIAQSDRVSDYESEGWEFESLWARHFKFNQHGEFSYCGCSSMVEHQPSKLNTWVRFPSPAPLMYQFKAQRRFFLLPIRTENSTKFSLICNNSFEHKKAFMVFFI